MHGHNSWAERSASQYLPYVGHVSPGIVLLEDGSLLAVAHLHGLPHELAAASERNAAARILSALWRQVADDVLTINVHLVRHQRVNAAPPPIFSNSFSAELARVYGDRVLDGQLFENSWYLSTIIAPRNPLGGATAGQQLSRTMAKLRKLLPAPAPDLIHETEDIWATLLRALDSYQIRRLGLRQARGIVFSEIAEALRIILTCEPLPVPLMSGPLASAIYTDRVIFGRRAFEIRAPDSQRYGAIFGFREYPPKTKPDMLDTVLSLPMPLVMSQSFAFINRTDALNKSGLKSSQMETAGDKALSQIEGWRGAGPAGLRPPCPRHHHFSLAVYADSMLELTRRAGLARTRLAEAGALIAQESNPGGMEAAYFAQLPGNLDWRTRPGAITAAIFRIWQISVRFRAAHEGRWGARNDAVQDDRRHRLRFYPACRRCRDDGHFRPHRVRQKHVFNDPFGDVRPVPSATTASSFSSIRTGEVSCWSARLTARIWWCVPANRAVWRRCAGSSDNPADRQFLVRWIKALIQLDGHGPLPPEDDARLARAVAAIMRLPAGLRSLEGLRQFLGWRDGRGAGARIERWCRGAGLGWAFDGDRDEVDIAARMVGFDLTAILGNPEIVNPAAQYLLYRIRSVIDGRRAVISLDECKAYLLHEQFREETEDFLLRGRKNNAVIILVTQEPEHLLEGTFGPTMVNQCFTKVFFRNPTADEEVHRGKLFLTEGEYRAIREDMLPGSRQCLIKRDSGASIVDFDLSAMPEFVAVLSGRANTVRFAERLRRSAGADWLREFMAKHREAVD